jgi:NADPH-dependent 2,4-dienoyl-CoA reductase/sulfur reductase-like enzyme
MTTGALQQFVYLKRLSPCRRAVIVGSELVAYSALLTLRHGGACAAAMLESGPRAVAFPRLGAVAAAAFGTRLVTGARIVAIHGDPHVSGLEIERAGRRETIVCDAVIFTGEFVPESALVRASHLEIDPGTGGPVIDQYGRCSDPTYFAAGNLLRPVEPAWRAWREGRAVARAMAAALRGDLAASRQHCVISVSPPLQFACPQRHAAGSEMEAAIGLHVRTMRPARGKLQVFADNQEIWSRAVSVGPLRRISIPVHPEALAANCLDIRISEI